MSARRVRSGVLRLAAVLLAGASLSACAAVTRDRAPAAPAGAYKVGPPYQVNGVWYHPREQPDYDETGLASWYGSQYHGRNTANGELFDQNALTAAHTTLPLPVLVEVTNLENGRKAVLRVNDRGPFVAGRIIDVSRAAAEELGFVQKGLARVRVRYLGPAPLSQAAVEPPAPPPPPPPAPPAEETGAVYVQAGAYSVYELAGREAERLAALGPVEVRAVQVDGITLYRVWIGPWRDQASAEAVRERARGRGVPDARIVRDGR